MRGRLLKFGLVLALGSLAGVAIAAPQGDGRWHGSRHGHHAHDKGRHHGHRGHHRQDWRRARVRHHDRRHHWRRGHRYTGMRHVVHDYGRHGLRAPPRGYRWVRADNDYLLVAIATSMILDIVTQ